MEKIKTLLIANRGEIAVRIVRTAKALKIWTIAIYTEADAASAHVVAADEAVLLSGPDSKAYLDGEQIIEIAKAHKVNAIIPGYGFLSENTEFAGQVAAAGMVFAGPSAECIESFGIKHTARDLATKADVPVVPGTKGLVSSEDEAVEEAQKMGFPVSLSLTHHHGLLINILGNAKSDRWRRRHGSTHLPLREGGQGVLQDCPIPWRDALQELRPVH